MTEDTEHFRRWTVLGYTALLLLAALAVSRLLPAVDLSARHLGVATMLAALVGLAEILQVRFRIGRHVDSSNLVEAAVAPLLVIAPNALGVATVVLGQLVAAGVRRNTPTKTAFNLAQWSLAFGVGALIWNQAQGGPQTLSGAATLLLAAMTAGIINLVAFSGLLVLLGKDLRALRPMLSTGWLLGLGVNTLLGLLFALAHEATAWSLLLAPVPLLVLHQAYQGYAEARTDRQRLAGMHRAASVLSDPLDPRKAIGAFLAAAAEVFDAGAATLVLKVEGGREVHHLHADTDEPTLVFQGEDTPSVEAAMTAHLGPAVVRAGSQGPLAEALRASGHESCLAVPLQDGVRVLGALLLLDQAGIDGRPAGQLSVLEALGREVANAFARGRLLESVLEERSKLATVVGATSDGIASLDETGRVRSWNPALTAITGLTERQVVGRQDALLALDARAPGGKPVDLTGWVSGPPLPAELSVRDATGGRRRLACSYSHATDEHGRTLVIVGRDVTPVQEFEALRAEFGRLVEQEAARRLVVEQLQAAVVPDQLEVDGLELSVTYVASDPTEPTGGDLWDWLRLPDGELHLAVVDVLGHGVAATKAALSVVHVLRSLALDSVPLEEMVARASALLERYDPELVATVVLARLDPVSGRLRVVSGGHPPALVLGADGAVRQITVTGGAIGWPGAGSDGVAELYLEPGEGLLLYTDGLVEARKDILEGLESLAREAASVAHLPVGELTEELVARALAGADRRDDTLALVVRRTRVCPPLPAGEGSGRSRRWELTPRRQGVSQVRRELVRWLDDQQLPAGDAALVVSELLANAVRAARSLVVVEARIDGGRLHLRVSDDGPGLVELPSDLLPDDDMEGSRGLFLVRKLSEGLHLDPEAVGTTLVCSLPLPAEIPVQGSV